MLYRDAVAKVLFHNNRVNKAVLFGSRAMQASIVRSDVDIAIFADSLPIGDFAKFAESMELISMPISESGDLP